MIGLVVTTSAVMTIPSSNGFTLYICDAIEHFTERAKINNTISCYSDYYVQLEEYLNVKVQRLEPSLRAKIVAGEDVESDPQLVITSFQTELSDRAVKHVDVNYKKFAEIGFTLAIVITSTQLIPSTATH